MNTTSPIVTAPAADVEVSTWRSPWARLFPLWRHAVWLVLLFSVAAMSVAVRLDVRQAQRDLHRNSHLTKEAQLQNERLRLEVQTRHRAVRMETQAAQLALGASVDQIRLDVP